MCILGLKPAAEASKTMKTPTMIQPKIPVPLNLPRLQPVHGFSASNSLSTGTPISPLIPSSSSLASVAITQLPTPQFYPTTGCMIRSPVSPQFLTPQPPSTQLSPVIPLSPAMFQVCIYISGFQRKEVINNYCSYYSTKTYVVGTQKNRLNDHATTDG